MFKTLKGILKTGNATIAYPFAPLERPEGARGKPEHDSIECIGCAACACVCPPNAIQMLIDVPAGTTTWSINFGRCIFCGRCEEVCPTKAIKLSPEFELAVMCKDDLEENCTYNLQACAACGNYYATVKEVDYAARILSQYQGDEEAAVARDLVSYCPACKREADAYRAKRRDETSSSKKVPISTGGVR